jgi:hypothetical protein
VDELLVIQKYSQETMLNPILFLEITINGNTIIENTDTIHNSPTAQTGIILYLY